ncbi:phage tail assembly chaperone G [Candidatus Syntrophocurvum alkaliphilum]|uniref:phage tail assembly chaperone G n=1 Tax=Candidatus Syntrophocurvum alkaliphilum TaxID=2293317 RepID=UPI0012E1DCAC|nr:hypothetical protein [Candidatus Syntrophocurvum alkaliphilum]
MQITLLIDGKEKTFVSDFISARMMRRTIEISQSINFEQISVDELDLMVEFLVQLFNKQFTLDDVYDGLPSKELVPTLISCINEVVGEMGSVTTGDEKNA